MADIASLREQIKRCQAWLSDNADNPDIAQQAKDSVRLVLHNAQRQLQTVTPHA